MSKVRISRTVIMTTIDYGEDGVKTVYGKYDPIKVMKDGGNVLGSKIVTLKWNLDDIIELAEVEE